MTHEGRMNTGKHTPGPWYFWSYGDCDGDPRLDGRAYTAHCFSFRQPKDEQDGFELGGSKEDLANARLIAAAPEMLSALLAIREWLLFNKDLTNPESEFWNDSFVKANNAANAAISKATGEQP